MGAINRCFTLKQIRPENEAFQGLAEGRGIKNANAEGMTSEDWVSEMLKENSVSKEVVCRMALKGKERTDI